MECPTCGKQLDTEQGIRIHHTRVHDERLPNRTCKGCGTEFYDPKARRTFCDDCNPNAGEHNGNWSGARQTTECERCGDEFEYYPSDKDGVYCPDCVEESDEFLGTPSWEGKLTELVTTPCEQCGADVTVRESKRRYGAGRFCSRECVATWQSENWRGEDHPGWEGGWNEDRINNWSAARRKVLERDDHTCQNCGSSAEDLEREPDVHHIVPIREFDDPNDAHTPDNLIVLCRGCHVAVEHGKIPLPEPTREDNH